MQISKLTLNNYRAFHNEKGEEYSKYTVDFSGKKNMLIYGENGSGKSSLFKGVKDLFLSSVQPELKFTQNVFPKDDELDEEPFVQVTFTDGDDTSDFKFSSDPSSTNTNEAILKAITRTRSFMTYRDLLRIHFINDPEVNLFNFLFVGNDSLLGEVSNPAPSQPETSLKMKELWENIQTKPDDVIIGDFCNSVNQILNDITPQLNALLNYFDSSLEVSFTPLTEQMLKDLNPRLVMSVKYFGVELSGDNEQYHLFLNEARLSALAICIFLAAHLSVPPQSYSILFLDDIFTGLDTSNRLPLLEILTSNPINGTSETLIHNQLILTTYDRSWYELAKNHLGEDDWSYQEIFIDKHSSGFDHPSILPGKDNFKRAKHYFKLKHYPACANHQRKLCEGLIKQFLPDHKKYDALPNGDIKPIDKLATLIDRFETYLAENSIDFTPFKKLRTCLRVVMNPLSHDDLDSPAYRRELELVFVIIEELKKLDNKLVLKAGQKIYMKKNHGKTGVNREYECELTSDVRQIKHGANIQNTRISILLLTQKDGTASRKKVSYEGSLPEIYNKFCHSLEIKEEANPLVDFELKDGKSLEDLFNE